MRIILLGIFSFVFAGGYRNRTNSFIRQNLTTQTRFYWVCFAGNPTPKQTTDPTLIHQHHLVSTSPQKLSSKYKMHKHLHTKSQKLFYPPVSSLRSENLPLWVFIYKCHRQAYTLSITMLFFIYGFFYFLFFLSTAHKGTCSPSRVWITYHHVHWASALRFMKGSTFVPACHNSCFTAICFLLFHSGFCSGFSSLSCVSQHV